MDQVEQPNWSLLREKAISVLPQEELGPKRYWVGVLNHHVAIERSLETDNFVWMKAHARILVHLIATKYREKWPGSEVDIMFNGESKAPNTALKDLNIYDDNIIIFRAVEKPARIPLSPVNRQTVHRPSTSASIRVKRDPSIAADDSGRYSRAHGLASSPAASANKENHANTSSDSARSPYTSSSVHKTRSTPGPQSRQPSATVLENQDRQSLPRTVKSEAIVPDPVPVLPGQPSADATTPHAAVKGEPVENSQPEPLEESHPRTALDSFDPDEFFAEDPGTDVEDEPSGRTFTDVSLRQLIDHQDPKILEAGVSRGLKVLDSLASAFTGFVESSPDANTWIQSIDKLKSQSIQKQTIVGVVGNTGAGKSSVINAMLDEERLVPTNCMRACTAVVTEISWNDSPNPWQKYRAEIEFITPAEWEKELNTLMKEFLTENGTVSRDSSDQSTDAGIAWAKFHAVYPRKTKDMLSECTVPGLMAEQKVLDVLGTTKKINRSSPVDFYRELQRFVDSKEKTTGKGKRDKHKPPPVMEYWPLIKVVKIRTKSPALSTGAVIVDLPGVHDSNAARAAVAQGYIKQCTGLWIVAPINRAVDDKAAKTLMGDSFKRQLKYDGGFQNITFICSKTDDISITEALDSLEVEDQVSPLEEQDQDYQRKVGELQEQIGTLRETKEVYRLTMNSADDDIEVWDGLKDDLDDGKTVFAPQTKPKRKRGKAKASKKSRKRRQKGGDDSDDDFIVSDVEVSDNSDEDDSDVEGVQAPREPLTSDDIKTKLDELRATKKNARRQRIEIEAQINDIRPELQDLKAKRAELRAEINAICISGRNEYSKGAIQRDFALGIKELDQENAAEEDEANFNPDEDVRDYEAVGNSLPVFCVSSRAYQKMCGRLVKDDPVPGFKVPEETEIPQLQEHCKKLTEAVRVQTCRPFLLKLCQQLNTFSLWASDNGDGLQLTDEEQRKQVAYLDQRLKELEKGLEKAVESCMNMAKKDMAEQIFDKYPDLIKEAMDAAPSTAQKWGAHRNDGGLLWATYKAIVRRDGVYASRAAGIRDFNAELVEPLIKRLATNWERTFQKRIPKAFELYAQDSSKVIRLFHDIMEERAQRNGVGLAQLSLLRTQIQAYEQMFKDLHGVLVASMNELQREANRDFTPTIVQNMMAAYQFCSNDFGPGTYMRMKNCMTDHIDKARQHMFHVAAQTVKDHLKNMCKNLEETMANRADEIFVHMRHDYMNVLGGVNVNPNAVMSKTEKTMRAEVRKVLSGIDEQFTPIANGVIEEPTLESPEQEMQEEADEVEEEDEDDAEDFDTAPTGEAAENDSVMGDDDGSNESRNLNATVQSDDGL